MQLVIAQKSRKHKYLRNITRNVHMVRALLLFEMFLYLLNLQIFFRIMWIYGEFWAYLSF